VAIVESKLKSGKLVLGSNVIPAVAPAIEVGCQPTNVRVEPTFEEVGDVVETLCGDKTSPDTTASYALMGTAIQDWDGAAATQLAKYSWEKNLQTVPFAWQPNASTFKITGNVQVRALIIGGDVGVRVTSDFEWPIQGAPTVIWPVAAGLMGEAEGEPTEPAPELQPQPA
jgi:hypothetical protein